YLFHDGLVVVALDLHLQHSAWREAPGAARNDTDQFLRIYSSRLGELYRQAVAFAVNRDNAEPRSLASKAGVFKERVDAIRNRAEAIRYFRSNSIQFFFIAGR